MADRLMVTVKHVHLSALYVTRLFLQRNRAITDLDGSLGAGASGQDIRVKRQCINDIGVLALRKLIGDKGMGELRLEAFKMHERMVIANVRSKRGLRQWHLDTKNIRRKEELERS